MEFPQIRGTNPFDYSSSSKKPDTEWPPRFMKVNHSFFFGALHRVAAHSFPCQFILKISSTPSLPAIEIAFIDPRRLARIRLCASPLQLPPISTLGFDPLLSPPSLSEFTTLLRKRSSPIKPILLDQTFSAGVGNWVADEILFHARVHPEQRSLDEEQVQRVWENMTYVCRTAVEVNADKNQFPEHWLMKHRWVRLFHTRSGGGVLMWLGRARERRKRKLTSYWYAA